MHSWVMDGIGIKEFLSLLILLLEKVSRAIGKQASKYWYEDEEEEEAEQVFSLSGWNLQIRILWQDSSIVVA